MTSLPYLTSLVTAFCWGIEPFITKYAHASPVIAWTIMMLTASAVASIIFLFKHKHVSALKVNQVAALILAGIIGPVLGYLLYTFSIVTAKTLTGVSAIAFSAPLITLLIECCIFKKRLNFKEILGALFVVSGIFILMVSS